MSFCSVVLNILFSTDVTIKVNAVKNDLTTELENAKTFAYVLMSIVGVFGLVAVVLDILTFKKQVNFLKVGRGLFYLC